MATAIRSIRSEAQWRWWTLGALAALYLVLTGIVASGLPARAPRTIATAITLDLTLTASAIMWWLGVRRGRLPAWLVVVVASWGVAAARRWVPGAPIGALMLAAGAFEVLTVGWIAVRLRRVVRATRAARAEGPIDALVAGLRAARVPARVAEVIGLELSVVWLAVSGWFRWPAPGGLTMRSSGWVSMAGVIGFLVVPETLAFHVALDAWTPIAAWISTLSSLYLLLWIAADLHAVRLYPARVVDGELRVVVGVRWRARIRLADVVRVTPARSVPEGALNLALVEPTVVLELCRPAEARGLLGRRRHGATVALTIDDPAALAAAVAAAALPAG